MELSAGRNHRTGKGEQGMLEIARWESVWQVVVDLWLLLAGLAVVTILVLFVICWIRKNKK